MSTATEKRSLAAAREDAEAFRAMFRDCYDRWEIAGSIRRRKSEVADIEHVIIPKFGEVAVSTGLFAEKQTANLVWHRLDALLGNGTVAKHIYGATGFRWGEKYRGVDFNGFNHEIFCADADNWGAILAIRTGPAEFSQRLVTTCQRYGYRMAEGYMRDAEGHKLPTASEESFFQYCGTAWAEPEARR